MKKKWREKNISINRHILEKPYIGYANDVGWKLIQKYEELAHVMGNLDDYLLQQIRDNMIDIEIMRQMEDLRYYRPNNIVNKWRN